jgi:hypothetical protein
MGSKIDSFGKLYRTKNNTVFVSSGANCPRIKLTGNTAKLRDDFSKGFKAGKMLFKATLD